MVYVRHSHDIHNLVRKYWSDDISVREIGRLVGISHNTVPGIARRLGLSPRHTGPARGPAARRIEIPKPKAPDAIGPIGDFPAGDACRFIAGEPDQNFQCCGHPGHPWCEFHTPRMTVKGRAV